MNHTHQQGRKVRDEHPRKVRRMFLKNKRGEAKKSTARAYEYPTKHFVSFIEREGIDSMRDVDGYLIEQWKNKRQDEVAPVTYQGNVKKIKTFIGFCERSNFITHGTFDAIDVPSIKTSDKSSDEQVDSAEAERLLDYLDTYEYATRQHVLFSVLWQTGCRISGAIGLDVDDVSVVNTDEYVIDYSNRPESGTPLKNDDGGERRVTITKELCALIEDYRQAHRHDVIDDYGREPLFTTESRRLTRQRAYKNFTALTRPCVYTDTCPHARDTDECEAARLKKKAFGCPSSKSLHPIRRGSITHHLNSGWPKQKVSERCDVSLDVLETHYNKQTKEDERQQRKKYVEQL